MDHVAHVHLAQSHSSADRSSNTGIGELELGIVHLGLVSAHRALKLPYLGRLGIKLLAGNDAAIFEEVFETRQVQLGIFERRLVFE